MNDELFVKGLLCALYSPNGAGKRFWHLMQSEPEALDGLHALKSWISALSHSNNIEKPYLDSALHCPFVSEHIADSIPRDISRTEAVEYLGKLAHDELRCKETARRIVARDRAQQQLLSIFTNAESAPVMKKTTQTVPPANQVHRHSEGMIRPFAVSMSSRRYNSKSRAEMPLDEMKKAVGYRGEIESNSNKSKFVRSFHVDEADRIGVYLETTSRGPRIRLEIPQEEKTDWTYNDIEIVGRNFPVTDELTILKYKKIWIADISAKPVVNAENIIAHSHILTKTTDGYLIEEICFPEVNAMVSIKSTLFEETKCWLAQEKESCCGEGLSDIIIIDRTDD